MPDHEDIEQWLEYLAEYEMNGYAASALEMIRDKEPVSLFPIEPDSRGYTDAFRCSACKCNVYMRNYSKECEFEYCPHCGRRVK